MKRKSTSPNLAMSALIFALIIITFPSCRKESLIPENENSLAELVAKVETEYTSGQDKTENGGENEAETFANKETISSVRERIKNYQEEYETRYKVARNLSEGYPVGVIPATDACPAGTEKVKFFMDNQDNGNSSKTGWTGAWSIDQNGNSWHT